MLLFLGILKWVLLAISLAAAGLLIYCVWDELNSNMEWDREFSAVIAGLSIFFLAPLIGFIYLSASYIPKYRAKYFSDEKLFERAVQQDMAELQTVALAQKLSLADVLVRTSEPSLYVIAPMSYDTKKFVEDNSHDKALFGTKDNSAERLAILESCITDFMGAVDGKTGVSFLDRSKISQIEKEHKFQLGDWSNDTKTAEMGKALNANVLLFLDKFGYVDTGSGEYRFEAKFVDINTMQSSSYNVAYQNAKKKVVTPGVVQTISFRDFTAISTRNTSFDDELFLTAKNALRTVQKYDMKAVSPLGGVPKFELSEYDTLAPKSELLSLSEMNVDGFGTAELSFGEKTETLPYTFEPCDIYIERIGNDFYTDGRIGTLTLKIGDGYEKYDVFTVNNREYFIRVGTAELPNATVNYYVQMARN